MGAKIDTKPSLVGHLLLSGSIVLTASVLLRLVDTDYAALVNNWRFEARTGLHHVAVPAVATLVYLLMLAFLPSFMKNRAPLQLQIPMLVHNFILSTGSLVCAVAIAREVYTILGQKDGLEAALCDSDVSHPNTRLYVWYFLFYLSKMYEFLDTAILILRKKPLIFLHVYHHIITLWLCWTMLEDRMSVQWLCTFANVVVHVFMYYFYACQSLGLDVWWKKYLTALQIWQFVMDEGGNAFWAYYRVALGLNCSGSWFGFWFGIGVIASFLVLFIDFYRRSYLKKSVLKTNAEHKLSLIKSELPTDKEE